MAEQWSVCWKGFCLNEVWLPGGDVEVFLLMWSLSAAMNVQKSLMLKLEILARTSPAVSLEWNVSNETLQKEKVFSMTVLLIVWLYTSGFRLFKPLTETDCIRVELCSPACGRMDLFVCLLRRSSLTFGSAWREAPPRRVLLHLCTHSSTMKRANGNSWEINLAVSFCLARWASESSGGNAAEWDHFSLKEALKVHLWQFRGFLPNWWGFTEDITEDQDQD